MESLPIIITGGSHVTYPTDPRIMMNVNCRFSRLSPVCFAWAKFSYCSYTSGGHKCIKDAHTCIKRVHGVKVAPPNSPYLQLYVLHEHSDGQLAVTTLGETTGSRKQTIVNTVPHLVATEFCDVVTNSLIDPASHPKLHKYMNRDYERATFIVTGVFVNVMSKADRYTVVVCIDSSKEVRAFAYSQRPFGCDYIMAAPTMQGPQGLTQIPTNWQWGYACARGSMLSDYGHHRDIPGVYTVYAQSPIDGHYDAFVITDDPFHCTDTCSHVHISSMAAYAGDVLIADYNGGNSVCATWADGIDPKAYYSLNTYYDEEYIQHTGVKYVKNGKIQIVMTTYPHCRAVDGTTPYLGILAHPGELYMYHRFLPSRREDYTREWISVRSRSDDRWRRSTMYELRGRVFYATNTPEYSVFEPLDEVVSACGMKLQVEDADTIDYILLAFDTAIVVINHNKTIMLSRKHKPIENVQNVNVQTLFDIIPADIVGLINKCVVDSPYWVRISDVGHSTKNVPYIWSKFTNRIGGH